MKNQVAAASQSFFVTLQPLLDVKQNLPGQRAGLSFCDLAQLGLDCWRQPNCQIAIFFQTVSPFLVRQRTPSTLSHSFPRFVNS